MLTGQDLGAAIDAARLIKKLSKKALAEHFSITPPSVQGWIKTGRIDKSKLIEVIDFFSDVVGPDHWGLSGRSANNLFLSDSYDAVAEMHAAAAHQIYPGSSARENGSSYKVTLEQGAGKSYAALKVLEMIKQHGGKSLSAEAQDRMAKAVAESLSEPTSNVVSGDFSRPARLTDGDVLIPQYDVRASMGNGQVPADYVDFVRNIVVSGPQLERLGLEYTSPANLSIITGWGQSMEGTINDKDPVIVDRGVTEFAGDGVYVLTWAGDLYIKRLQKADADRFDMISDNEKHKDRTVPVEDVTIHAKVLLVWNAKRL
jgi:phage repressor protein C with HTH and peptisase S24 domain